MLRWSLAESADQFWWPEEFKNMVSPDYANLKHLQNPGHLSLIAPNMTQGYPCSKQMCPIDTNM